MVEVVEMEPTTTIVFKIAEKKKFIKIHKINSRNEYPELEIDKTGTQFVSGDLGISISILCIQPDKKRFFL